MASQRLRRTYIRSLGVDGITVVSHVAKAEAFHGFYSGLLGLARATEWRFSLEALYVGAPLVDATKLEAPFCMSEVAAPVAGLYHSSAPGSDGLGPGFYQAAWPMVVG